MTTKTHSNAEVMAEFENAFIDVQPEEIGSRWKKNSNPDSLAIMLRTLLDQKDRAVADARREALQNVPVGFVRQWINEDLLRPGHKLITNEQIQGFINIAIPPPDQTANPTN